MDAMPAWSGRAPVVARRTLLAAAVAGLVAACGSGETKDEPRRLTATEAELFATTRFSLYRQGTVPVRMAMPGSPATTISARLVLDEGYAFGVLRSKAGDGLSAVTRAIAWTLDAVTTAPLVDDEPVPAASSAQWTERALSTDNRQDLFLALALNLGSDRPENPLLLRRGTARHLRKDIVGGVDVDVFQGPRPAGDTSSSRTRYWLDSEGGLRRFEGYLGDASGRPATLTVVDRVSLPKGLQEAAATVLSARSES